MVNTELLKYLETLITDDVNSRLESIIGIVQVVVKNQIDDVICTRYKDILCKDNEVLNYLLNRLIRGLSSGRHSARIGFSICLSLIIKKWKNLILPDEILNLFFKSTDFNKNDSNREIKDYMLGRIWGSYAFQQGDMLKISSDEKVAKLIERLVEVYFKRPPFSQCVSFVLYLISKENKIKISQKLDDLQTEVWSAREAKIKLKVEYLWEKIKINLSKTSNLYPLIPISWFAAFEYLKEPEFFQLWYLFSSEICTKEHPNELVFTFILFSPVIFLLAIEKPNGVAEFFTNGLDYLKYLVRPKKALLDVSQSTLNTITSILARKNHSNETLNSFITLSTLCDHPPNLPNNITIEGFNIFEYLYAADSENKLQRLFQSIEELNTCKVVISEVIKRIDFALWYANYSKRYAFNIISEISKGSILLNGKNAKIYTKVLNKLLSTKKYELFNDLKYYQSEALNACFIVSQWYNSCIVDSKIIQRLSRVMNKALNHEKSDRLLSKFAMKLSLHSGSSPEVGLAHTIGFIIWSEKSIYLPKSLLYDLVDPDSNMIEYIKPEESEEPEDDVLLEESDITSILTQEDPFLKRLKNATPSKWSSNHIEKRIRSLDLLLVYINSWIKAQDKDGIISQKTTLDMVATLFETFVKSFLKDSSTNANLKVFADKLQVVIMQMVNLLKYNNPMPVSIKRAQKRIFELCNTRKSDKNSTLKIHNLGIRLLSILDEYGERKNVKIGGINLVNRCISNRGYGRSALLLLATNLPRVFTNFDLDKARVPTLAGLALEAATKAAKNRKVDRADFVNQLDNVMNYVRSKYVDSSIPNCINKNLKKFSNFINPDNNMLEGAGVRFQSSIEITASN